jgi:hypothetical protein
MKHALLIGEPASHAFHVLPVECADPVAPLGVDKAGSEHVGLLLSPKMHR